MEVPKVYEVGRCRWRALERVAAVDAEARLSWREHAAAGAGLVGGGHVEAALGAEAAARMRVAAPRARHRCGAATRLPGDGFVRIGLTPRAANADSAAGVDAVLADRAVAAGALDVALGGQGLRLGQRLVSRAARTHAGQTGRRRIDDATREQASDSTQQPIELSHAVRLERAAPLAATLGTRELELEPGVQIVAAGSDLAVVLQRHGARAGVLDIHKAVT